MFSLKSIVILNWPVKANLRMMSLLKDKAFVNGKWVSGKKNEKFDVVNPATGKTIASVPNMDVEDVTLAIESAAEAFKKWKNTTPKARSDHLRRWFELVAENADEIADVITAEAGKPKTESLVEVAYGNSFLEWFSEQARRINGEVVDGQTTTKQIIFIKQPIGVVGLITPWNFPLGMITRKAGPALAAGCTCVIKPAEDTPLTALVLAELSQQAGIPPGVVNVITCDRQHAPQIGELLCRHKQVAGISFTGSTTVGKILYGHCAEGVKRIGLELGGNAPFIVFKSANIDKAVEGAMASKFRNCGQTCVSANRFLIEQPVVDEFIDKISKKVDSLVSGNGSQKGVTLGPLINQAQITKVTDIVKDAVSKGAKLLKGGKPLKDVGELFYAPTIITDVTAEMQCYHNEIFGPVVQVIPFQTEEEALAIANSTNCGLAGYFYSEDISQVWRVARALEMGMVGINEGIISYPEAAFGGVKESGIGREGSHHGIDEYINIKYLCFGNLSRVH